MRVTIKQLQNEIKKLSTAVENALRLGLNYRNDLREADDRNLILRKRIDSLNLELFEKDRTIEVLKDDSQTQQYAMRLMKEDFYKRLANCLDNHINKATRQCVHMEKTVHMPYENAMNSRDESEYEAIKSPTRG